MIVEKYEKVATLCKLLKISPVITPCFSLEIIVVEN